MAENVLHLDIPSPFADLVAACETECAAECCGVAAYDRTPDAIAVWVLKAGMIPAHMAVDQARTLAELVGKHDGTVCSYPHFNLCWEAGPTAHYLSEWAFNTEKAIEKVAFGSDSSP
ncbi:MAG TPA: DUF6331 family protein [Rhodothermales bacterium]|nr:DUF6331 family protein [Rhodothermales bacterium]